MSVARSAVSARTFALAPHLLLLLNAAPGAGSSKDVYGNTLQTCSQPGTAMTGFTRDGRCADVGPADAGAHHVCIQMKSDFCRVTGQPNWCTERDFPCMGQRGTCKIGNWCVCQWAFARYLERAGGCDSIVDLVCEATHIAAFEAYERSSRPEHKVALECIKRRCGIGQPQVANATAAALAAAEGVLEQREDSAAGVGAPAAKAKAEAAGSADASCPADGTRACTA
eukprot:TRINITY_DN37878_c0_g1_i1.p2 TRINITY_DN37878_c0_g1~~TRINITY_DN37878_c0_g1_i1.p2  ORF type:complete len:226 (+),score=51.07 TRINITY_DN37878_c0_g1_i1:81-758(+)